MSAPADHIVVAHGNLTVNIPRSIFACYNCIDLKGTEEFKRMLMERYPWISENSFAVILKNAKKEFIRVIDEETCGRYTALHLISLGKDEEAVSHLKKHLNNNDDNASWRLLGELLCKCGRTKEGYKILNRSK